MTAPQYKSFLGKGSSGKEMECEIESFDFRMEATTGVDELQEDRLWKSTTSGEKIQELICAPPAIMWAQCPQTK